jgi:hypothetical protein
MKAISIWQPWAAAMQHGKKQVETRHWRTNYRGPILIHAAKRWTRNEREVADRLFPTATIDLGAIVAIGVLIDCLPTEDLRLVVSAQEIAWGNFSDGRFGWVFDQVQPLEPIPYRGQQGLFEVPDGAISLILREHKKSLTRTNQELFQRLYLGRWD